MFNCELQLYIVRKDGEAVLKRLIEIPFVPVVGMDLILSESEYGDEFIPELVQFDCHRNLFVLTEHSPADGIVDECDCLEQEECDFCCLRPELDRLEALGWTVCIERRGYERLSSFHGMAEPEKHFAEKFRLGL